MSVTLLSGCSLFSGEEDVVKMAPLPKVENQFTPETAWSTSVGDGVGDFYPICIPPAGRHRMPPTAIVNRESARRQQRQKWKVNL